MAWRGSSNPNSPLTVGELREREELDPQVILRLVHRLRMGQLDRQATLALAAALGEPELASEDMDRVEAALARMNTRVRRRPPQDFRRELEEAAARRVTRTPVAVRRPQEAAPRRARTPRSRRVTRARPPTGDDPSDSSEPPLSVVSLAAFRLELERALGGPPSGGRL